jgi:hypothetical protein
LNKARLILCFPFLFAVSCSSSGDGGGSADAARPAASTGANVTSVDEWVAGKSKDNGYKQDANGNWVPKSDKRSSFESQGQSAYFKGEYAKKEFNGGKEYAKKSWWGDTQYQSKQYQGDTDGSRFQTSSKFQGTQARDARKAADIPDNYQTGSYATGSARESSGKRIEHSSDAETDFRRKVYTAPSVVDWREQRAMDVNQTKGILGR